MSTLYQPSSAATQSFSVKANPTIAVSNYSCPKCNKSFSTNGNMKNHFQTIHQNFRPFKCSFPFCSKTYSNKSRLTVHIRTHTGLKPFTCPICSKSFNEKGNLKTHISFHSNTRPFKCNLCNKTYKTNGHLKDHIQIQHMQMRKFICDKCDSKFGRKSTLIAHMKTHADEKLFKFKVDLCRKYFSEKRSMKAHSERHIKKLLNKNGDNRDRNECAVWEGSSTGECSSDDVKGRKSDKIVDLYETESEDSYDEKENVLSINNDNCKCMTNVIYDNVLL